MLVKVGIAESSRVIEIETEDPEAFRATIEEAFSQARSVMWFEDTKRRLVGVPVPRLAYVEIEQEVGVRKIGFGRATS
ncbi:MAG: DUF3107 family protein [Acidimicrobiia bacterium]